MVAQQQEHGYAGEGQACDAAGELALVSLARVAALVRVSTEEREVYPLFNGEVYDLVEALQKVQQPRGQAPSTGRSARRFLPLCERR